MISPVPSRPTGESSSTGAGGIGAEPAATAARWARRCAINAAVVPMLSTAIAAMASRIAWSPNQPMMNVASGGPATQATETIARVFTMSAVRAPE